MKFDVIFPPNNWLDKSKIPNLEALLPPRTPLAAVAAGAHVEEVVLSEVDPNRKDRGNDEMDEDEDGHGHGPQVQCAQQ